MVFVTAYDQYALRAFEVHAVDYLLKPFTRERWRGPGARQAAARRAAAAARRLAAAARPPGGTSERLLVKDGPNVHVIPVDRLD